jgi:uncharacterized membrane protein YecN with MAPEG domain
MPLPISLTAAAAAALLHIWLSLRVSQVRRAVRVELGDGGSEPLTRRMRAHANFAENAPFFLVLLVLLELSGAHTAFLWAAVIIFILARLCHAFGMDRKGANPLRIIGIVLSLAVIGALAVWAITTTYLEMGQPAERQQAPSIRAGTEAPGARS